jgi:hypothetical protein
VDNSSVIKGVGKDAEIEENAQGGLQSKSPAFLHLVDPFFLEYFVALQENEDNTDEVAAVCSICKYMRNDDHENYTMLIQAVIDLESNGIKVVMTTGKILKYGATEGNGRKGYPINNWRQINRESHLNHALIHLVACIAEDKQDDHRGHAICRLHMAIATKETEGFCYTKPFGSVE